MRPLSLLLLLMVLVAAVPADAKTTVIDDSGTLPYDAPLLLHWQQLSPRRPVNNRMTGTLTLRVKLNVAPWLRRPGRIYLVLPAQQPGAMNASWSTQGRMLAGRVRSGTRSLVYSGLITTPFIEDVLQLTLEVDGTRMRQLYHVNFRFEMDED
jgi:hypothetical protein